MVSNRVSNAESLRSEHRFSLGSWPNGPLVGLHPLLSAVRAEEETSNGMVTRPLARREDNADSSVALVYRSMSASWWSRLP